MDYENDDIELEIEGEGDTSELNLVRDARGNWVDADTGEIFAKVYEPEDGDADEDT